MAILQRLTLDNNDRVTDFHANNNDNNNNHKKQDKHQTMTQKMLK